MKKQSKRKPFKSWKTTLNAVLKEHNKATSKGGKAVGNSTQASRREVLDKGFKQLRELGYKLNDVKGFKEKHIKALGYHWEEKKLSASTIQNRISIFRTFSAWIGKKGMVRDAIYYVRNKESTGRHSVAQENRTWSGKEIDIEEKLKEVEKLDQRVALQLMLQRAFGIRMKEAALLKPHGADKSGYLSVNWGTKGGRPRAVPIEEAYQREVLEKAKQYVSNQTSSLIPKEMSFEQWKNHYYYICKQAGISRKQGITSHGLRHERLNEIYTKMTGERSPICGGNKGQVDAELDQIARQEVAEVAGHSRESIASMYLGGKSKS